MIVLFCSGICLNNNIVKANTKKHYKKFKDIPSSLIEYICCKSCPIRGICRNIDQCSNSLCKPEMTLPAMVVDKL